MSAEADEREKEKYQERAVNRVKVEELVARVRKEEEESGKKGISLIVVGESCLVRPEQRGYSVSCQLRPHPADRRTVIRIATWSHVQAHS